MRIERFVNKRQLRGGKEMVSIQVYFYLDNCAA